MLTSCKECSAEVSSKAKSCPNCGRLTPLTEWRANVRSARLYVAILIALLLVSVPLGVNSGGIVTQLLATVGVLAFLFAGTWWIKPPDGVADDEE